VPQLLIHGTSDSIVPYAMSQVYVRAANAAGDRVELETIDGAEHLDLWNPESAAFDRVVEAATTFFTACSAR
jgi:pimeloyl-ACP methyl ester carboxylesterase